MFPCWQKAGGVNGDGGVTFSIHSLKTKSGGKSVGEEKGRLDFFPGICGADQRASALFLALGGCSAFDTRSERWDAAPDGLRSGKTSTLLTCKVMICLPLLEREQPYSYGWSYTAAACDLRRTLSSLQTGGESGRDAAAPVKETLCSITGNNTIQPSLRVKKHPQTAAAGGVSTQS